MRATPSAPQAAPMPAAAEEERLEPVDVPLLSEGEGVGVETGVVMSATAVPEARALDGLESAVDVGVDEEESAGSVVDAARSEL